MKKSIMSVFAVSCVVFGCSGEVSDSTGASSGALGGADPEGLRPRPGFVVADLVIVRPGDETTPAPMPDEAAAPDAPHVRIPLLVPPPPREGDKPCIVHRGEELDREPLPPPPPPTGATPPPKPELPPVDADADAPMLVQVALFDHPPPPPAKGETAPAKPPRPVAIATCLVPPGKDPTKAVPREVMDWLLTGEHPSDAVLHVVVVKLPPPPSDGKPMEPPPKDGESGGPMAAPPPPLVHGTMSIVRVADLPKPE